MNHTDVIKKVMTQEGVRQIDLVKQIGAASQSVVSARINQKNISAKALLEILDSMGYEIVVRKSYGEYRDGEYPIRLADYTE